MLTFSPWSRAPASPRSGILCRYVACVTASGVFRLASSRGGTSPAGAVYAAGLLTRDAL